jgi:hypothetical protein
VGHDAADIAGFDFRTYPWVLLAASRPPFENRKGWGTLSGGGLLKTEVKARPSTSQITAVAVICSGGFYKRGCQVKTLYPSQGSFVFLGIQPPVGSSAAASIMLFTSPRIPDYTWFVRSGSER